MSGKKARKNTYSPSVMDGQGCEFAERHVDISDGQDQYETERNIQANVVSSREKLEEMNTEIIQLKRERDEALENLKKIGEEIIELKEERDEALENLKKFGKEIVELKEERDEALVKLEKSNIFLYRNLKELPAKFIYYTGITVDVFERVLTYLLPCLPGPCVYKMPYEDQLLATLMKLRLDECFDTLADMFVVSKSNLADTFWRWVNLLESKMSFLIKSPDREATIKTLPPAFKKDFPRLTAIIDCTEILIHRPRTLLARSQVYSNYKHHSTVKFLIACTPHGSISFLSKVWGGRVSDVELTRQSGFIDPKYHHHGDQILADRGFPLFDDFMSACGVELLVPSFTRGKLQLSAREVEITRKIASVRIHIERVIGILKNRYTILQGPLPITTVKRLSDERDGSEFSSIDKILRVCAIMVNLGEGVVYKE